MKNVMLISNELFYLLALPSVSQKATGLGEGSGRGKLWESVLRKREWTDSNGA